MAASDPRSPGAASNSAPSIGLGSIRMDRLARCPQRGGELVSRRAGSRFVRRACRSFGAAARTKPSAAFALILAAAAHAVGWPMPRGGSGKIASALAGYLRSLGGRIHTGLRVDSIEQISGSMLALLDVAPQRSEEH